MSDLDQATVSVLQVIIFTGLSLLFAGLVEALPNKILRYFPQSVLVLLLFLAIGLIAKSIYDKVPQTTNMQNLIENLELSPEGIQLIFLPPLIFSELFKINVHVFLNVIIQVLLLAFPGVLIGMCLTAIFPVYILPTSWSWYEALAFGGMLSATDPVAVIAVLHDLGASKRLSSIIGGESVLNDGSAIVVVTLFLELQQGVYFSSGDIVAFIFRETLGSFALGGAFGIATVVMFPFLKNNPTPLVAWTVAMPYLCFSVAMILEMSGVLALVPLGLMANAFGRATIVGAVADRMEHFWNVLEFIANSVLFAISGLFIADDLLKGDLYASDWGYLFLLYIFIIVVRCITILILYPLMRHTGYGFSVREATVCWWGGLRGAVGLTLAFIIRNNAGVDNRVGSLVTFFMGGIVTLTLVCNATTSGPLVKGLGLQHAPDEMILGELIRQFKDSAAKSLVFAGGTKEKIDEALFPHAAHESAANLPAPEPATGKKKKGQMREQLSSPLDSQRRILAPSSLTLQEKRRHFLLAQSVTYNRLLNREIIGRSPWFILMHSIDTQLDERDSALNQWNLIIREPLAKLQFWAIRTQGTPTDKRLLRIFMQEETFDIEDMPEDIAVQVDVQGGEATSASCCTCCIASEDKPRHKWCCKGCSGGNLGEGTVSRALYVLTSVAYAYLRAHEVSRAAIDAFQSGADKLKLMRLSLVSESLEACATPAGFLNAVKVFRPDVLKRVKAVQLATSIRWTLLDKALLLSELGLLEHNELHPLVEIAEEIFSASASVELGLNASSMFTRAGDFDKNSDLYPFVPDLAQKTGAAKNKEKAKEKEEKLLAIEEQDSIEEEDVSFSKESDDDQKKSFVHSHGELTEAESEQLTAGTTSENSEDDDSEEEEQEQRQRAISQMLHNEAGTQQTQDLVLKNNKAGQWYE